MIFSRFPFFIFLFYFFFLTLFFILPYFEHFYISLSKNIMVFIKILEIPVSAEQRICLGTF